MENFQYKIVSSLEKVFATKEPSGEGAPAKLTAFRGENVSFQIAYAWSGELKENGTISIKSPLKEQVQVRMVQLVPCEYPCHEKRDGDYLVTEPGLYPDLLSEIPERGFPFVRGQWRSLWIDIQVEENTKAGIYPVELKLLHNGEVMGEIRIDCEVLDAVLPKLSIPHTEWFHTDCIANYYKTEVFSETYWEIVEHYVQTAVKRNCNMLLTPIFTPPLDTEVGGERPTVQLVDVKEENGSYTFGFEKFERWVAMCKRCGVEYFEMSHLFTQWGASAAPKIMVEKDGKLVQKFGWDTVAAGQEYADFLHQFLPALKQELVKLQIQGKTYFHVSDEPAMSQLASYRAARNVAAEHLQDCEVFDALSDYDFYKEGIVTQPVCAIDHMEPFLENRPEKLWGYYCTAQCQEVSNRFIALPGYRTRILGAQLYKYQLSGFLHWGYNFYNTERSLFQIDPYRCTDAGGSFPSGDAFLVYPGADGRPEESIRMMLMNEAMNDLRAMNYQEQLTDRETVMNCIESSTEEEITFKKYPRSISYMTACRERINEAVKDKISAAKHVF